MSDASQGEGWWRAADGKWYAPEPVPAALQHVVGTTPLLVSVGDIGITATDVVTPTGRHPLKGTTWIVNNQSRVIERIPTSSIILAIVFAIFCLIGLLFLLVKEKRVEGYVQVSVQGPGLYYATQVPITDLAQVAEVERRVNYIRSLAA